jgi:predicted anti-sigma-YlaC factor YlaD
MRCEPVQEELARDSVSPELIEEVNRHLADCSDCRRVQLLYARIDESLKRAPVWVPPEGFAKTVAARSVPALQNLPEPPRILPLDLVRGGVLSLVAIAVMFLVLMVFVQMGLPLLSAMASHALPIAWASAVLSLLMSFWLTRRALR